MCPLNLNFHITFETSLALLGGVLVLGSFYLIYTWSSTEWQHHCYVNLHDDAASHLTSFSYVVQVCSAHWSKASLLLSSSKWLQNVVSLGAREWMSEWVREWLNEWGGEWVSEWVSGDGWIVEWGVSKWVNEWVGGDEWEVGWVKVREWLIDWVDEWVSEWVSEWVIVCDCVYVNGWEWVNILVSEWVGELVNSWVEVS